MALSIQERLKDLRVERKLTLEQLAEKTWLSKSALGSYESDDYKDISHHAINKLADFYGVTSDYLLARTETKSYPNAELADLRLNDDMINLLKDGRIDTALLCELATHPDGHDKTTYLLQSAHVDEGDYFNSRVHKDIDAIMDDLRKAHKGRSDSAPVNTVAEELKKDLEEAGITAKSAVNQLMTLRNWAIGYYIVEYEQDGSDRAEYETHLLKNLENKIAQKRHELHAI